jgi:hypothetical protein
MDRRDFLKGVAGSGAGVVALLGAVGGASRGLAQGAQGSQTAAAAAEGSESERALLELCRAVEEVDAGFADPAWRLQGPADYAEARRYLIHTLQHAIEAWFEADPGHPAFVRFVTPEKKLLGDNPDAIYFTTPVSAEHTYLIRGSLAGATYTSFTVELGTGEGQSSRRVGATLNDTEFASEPDGSYELIASAEPQEGNWLRLDPDAGSVTTRHYYERDRSIAANRLHHVPITIEVLDSVGPPPVPSDASVSAGLRRVANFLRSTVRPPGGPGETPRWVSLVPNQLPAPKLEASNEEVGFAAVDNVYSMAPYLLKPGEALVIRGRFPVCRFANVVLWNRFLQTYDYEQRRTSLNRRQVVLEKDGSFVIVVAHEDPGVANWLDTEGRPFGQIFWRFQLPEGEIEPLRTQVVPLASLRKG